MKFWKKRCDHHLHDSRWEERKPEAVVPCGTKGVAHYLQISRCCRCGQEFVTADTIFDPRWNFRDITVLKSPVPYRRYPS